jgi:hypothetical protein
LELLLACIIRRLQQTDGIFRIVKDILVVSDTLARHEAAVQKVLAALDTADISLNTEKVQYCKEQVKFGGVIISAGKYEIDPALTDELRHFPIPHDRHMLQSFISLARWLGSGSRSTMRHSSRCARSSAARHT